MTDSDQTASAGTGYRRWRRIFGGIFIVSSAVLVLLGVLVFGPFFAGYPPTGVSPTGAPAATGTYPPGVSTPTPGPTKIPVNPPAGAGGLGSYASTFAIATSCLTAASSLAGFTVTTVLGIRKERREDKSAELARQIQQLEIEKQRLELERRRREAGGGDQTGKKQ